MAEIGRRLGYENPSYFSQLLNGQKVPAADLPDRLAALDHRINPAYLRGTSDEPLVSSAGTLFPQAPSAPAPVPAPAPAPKKKAPADGVLIPAGLVQMFTDMAATIRMQQETIRLQVLASSGFAEGKKGDGSAG